MKILIADRFSEDAQTRLRRSSFDVIYDPDLKDDALRQAIANTGANVLVVRSTRVNAAMLDPDHVSLVIRAGAGFNTIDVKAASERGVYVANCPGMNSNSVAELAFGLMLSIDRHIPANVQDLKEGRWNKAGYSNALGLFGRTLGLIGVGRVGQAMIPRARAFGMPISAWSRSLTPERADELDVEMMRSPIEVAANSGIVSVHIALNDDTRHLIDARFFDAMRPSAMLINTARAEVVDESALADAVRGKGIRAGLDVFEGEPTSGTGTFENDLFKLKGVIGTHHIGGATAEAHQAIADETVRIICEYRNTGVPPNAVT